MSRKKDSNSKTPDESGDELWAYVTKDVAPLHPARPEQSLEAENTAQKASAAKRKSKQAVVTPRPVPPAQKQPPANGLDRRTDERLRRGQMEIDATLDLHGRTQEEAYAALMGFVESGYAQGKRCVLIITGKGRTSPGVLKQRVPEWLQEARVASLILRFYPAQVKDGGQGALYVLLRRKRK